MSEVRVKKSVALSGVVAGDTALSTVGHTGNDLHYRGYEINDLLSLSRSRLILISSFFVKPLFSLLSSSVNFFNLRIELLIVFQFVNIPPGHL